jgi:hypothetical protein
LQQQDHYEIIKDILKNNDLFVNIKIKLPAKEEKFSKEIIQKLEVKRDEYNKKN